MTPLQSQVIAVWAAVVISVAGTLLVERLLRGNRRTRLHIVAAGLVVPVLVLGVPWVFDTVERLLRSKEAAQLAVDLEVRAGASLWAPATTARPGDTLEFQLALRNLGPGDVEDVIARVNEAPGLRFTPHTVKLKNDGSPQGRSLGPTGAALFTTGVQVGTYRSGAAAYLYWQAQVSADVPSSREYRVVGVARDSVNGGNEIYNTAIVTVNI